MIMMMMIQMRAIKVMMNQCDDDNIAHEYISWDDDIKVMTIYLGMMALKQ